MGKKSKQKSTEKTGKIGIGIDPGNEGAIVLTNGEDFIEIFEMPVTRETDRQIDFGQVLDFLSTKVDQPMPHVFLERAVSFGMGTKGAFNYGRGFQSVVIALSLRRFPVTYVEPGKWAKEMHEGIARDLKPKAKSLIAVERLYPHLVRKLPKNRRGRLLDGPVDALLIAGYGLRKLNGKPEIPVTTVTTEDVGDFY